MRLARSPDLLILDLDGVLVDSEPLAARILCEALAEAGHPLDEASAYERFLGRSMPAIQAELERDLGPLPGVFDEAVRDRLYDAMRRELKPMPGAAAMLDSTPMARCVASSSRPERIELALEVTGLLGRLAPHLFSATMVKRSKPAPDLFLHASRAMGISPGRCLVIEDTTTGIAAARAAGMRVLGFAGGTHAKGNGYADRLAAAGAERVVRHLREVADLVE
jgi:HAD superfamily hydrolase (TIGR01509 family)